MYQNDGNTFGSSSITVDIPNKTPELHTILQELEKESYLLEENITGLSARLVPVSVPETQTQPMKAISDTINQAHSAVFLQVNSIRVKLTSLNILLSDIKQRLEV